MHPMGITLPKPLELLDIATPADIVRLMKSVPLFLDTTAAQRRNLAGKLSLRGLPANSTIMERGENTGCVYIVLSGSVKIFVVRPGEYPTLIGLLGHGEVLGELSALDGSFHSASVCTLERSRFLHMERSDFVQALHEVPVLSLNLARLLARRLRRITDQFEAMASLDVPGRVVRQLLIFAHDYGREADDGGTVIPLRLTQADLAGLTGSSRERVNKTIAFHRRQGDLTLNAGHHFTLHDGEAMATYHRLPWPLW